MILQQFFERIWQISAVKILPDAAGCFHEDAPLQELSWPNLWLFA